ncbi:YcxB family protein [Pseudoalteromonas sp. DL2-H2.2]|uniref:YcxB family protein n=1 Tax=Pseudoalteromonas sp. DL2-H2.2 TaxID=2908889 RepID=UPI001F484C0C|nr:YcxB family protein [Pseudoalteromonas sp. DL2-H2.2]MCF2911244.1 YcxB family protein [Pseudoalteromonas sp. DL2-H2.2]
MNMRKNFNITKSSYYLAYREFFHANNVSWTIYGVMACCGLFIGAVLYWLNLDYIFPNWLIALMFPALMYLVILFVHKLTVNASFKENPERFGEKVFEFSDSGIYQGGSNQLISWGKINNFRKSKNYMLLYGASEEAFIILPNKIFSASEISKIENWVGGRGC